VRAVLGTAGNEVANLAKKSPCWNCDVFQMKYFSQETAGAVAVCFYCGQVLCKSCMQPRAEERMVCSTRVGGAHGVTGPTRLVLADGAHGVTRPTRLVLVDGAHGVTRPTGYHLGIIADVVFDAQGGSAAGYIGHR